MSVTPEDIAVALGRTTPDETTWAQWDMWITDARMLISARLGDLEELDQGRLDYVVREAVAAHIRHPDDVTRVEVSVDDARSSREYRTGRGRVTILDEWWDLLSPSNSTAGAFSILPFGANVCHMPWCNLAFGANWCSCGADIAGYPIYENC